MAESMGVPFLGKVPLDPALSRAAEEGRSVFEDAPNIPQQQDGSAPSGLQQVAMAASAPALQAIIDQLLTAFGSPQAGGTSA